MVVFAVWFLSLATPNQTKADSIGPVWYLVQVTKGVSNEVVNIASVQKKQVSEVQLETDNTDTVAAVVSKVQEKLADLDWTEPNGTKPGKEVNAGGIIFRMDIHSFGCGVYYFEYPGNGYDRLMYGKVFGETLATWRKERGSPNISVAPNLAYGQNNNILGYFVTINR
jgi:hypothetical protein